MKVLLSIFFCLLICSTSFACDLTQPDKIKHMQVAKKTTKIMKTTFLVPLLPIKPVKWIFNDKIQLIFPDNYVPHILASTLVFTAGVLKEVPFDLISPKGHVEACDIVADYVGIKEGLKK